MGARWWTAAAAVLVMAGCSVAEIGGDRVTPESAPTLATATAAMSAGVMLAQHGLGELAGEEVDVVLERLEAMPLDERPTDLLVQVRTDSVVLSDGRSEAELPLPDGRSYLAVAPYVEHTHECFLHSVTTCTGELADTTVDVVVRDADGAVVLEDRVTTGPNGFVGLWLPRGLEGTLEMRADGLGGEVPVTTLPDGATCVTELRLA